ncbi:MAG: hypothetical protein K2Y04_09265 [Caulobacteraceae bacterium]|nr:hypothetical protein [Caulobacteraceae bacterium]NBB52691.1 hypothetical protein [Rhizobium sp. CRIBSB]
MALGLNACDPATSNQPPTTATATQPQRVEDLPGFKAGYEGAAGHAIDARRFTKTEFSNYAFNRTKAQIRAEFGSPDVVQDSTDSWMYTSLAVFDADAGTRAQVVTIQFTGLPSPDDVVADVRF